jgi:hypothetical protein
MLEMETVPQSCIPLVQIGLSIVLYMRSLMLVESFDSKGVTTGSHSLYNRPRHVRAMLTFAEYNADIGVKFILMPGAQSDSYCVFLFYIDSMGTPRKPGIFDEN